MDLNTARGVKEELWSLVDRVRVRSPGPVRFGGSTTTERPAEIALGITPTDSRGQFRIAVRATSEKELPEDVLAQIRQRTVNEVDVRYTGPIRAIAGRSVAPTVRPLAVGASVGHVRSGTGTLGFFARRLADGAIGIVSNNHVLAANDAGQERDEILQPGPMDRGTSPRDVIAYLAGAYPRLRQVGAALDCAFAPLVYGMQFEPAPGRQQLALAPATLGEEHLVCKIGRSTGQTFGRVTALEVDRVPVDYPFGRVTFTSQIEIDTTEGRPFSEPGDSGSLVFTFPYRHPLGLIFAGSLRGGAANLGLTFANPIHWVLTSLGVTVLT